MKPLKEMKIRITSQEHCNAVMACLERLGYVIWLGNSRKLPEGANAIYVYYDKEYVLSFGGSSSYFEREEGTEVTLEDLLAMLAEQSDDMTKEPDVNFNPENTISTYTEQLQQLLKDAKVSVSIYHDEITIFNVDNDDQAVVKSWDEVLEVIKVKQQYLAKFNG